MKLVIGLGNPDSKYNFTRHNFGFLVLDLYAKSHQQTWQNPKFNALWFKGGDTIFIKPQTYYNNSGQAVKAFMQYYKISPDQILVVCDDFDLKFGTIRLRHQGSSGGNNGLKSITEYLHTSDFARLRLGTNNRELRQKIGDIDFVLSRFTSEENTKLPQICKEAIARIEDFIKQ